jgi:hypothetical protein
MSAEMLALRNEAHQAAEDAEFFKNKLLEAETYIKHID